LHVLDPALKEGRDRHAGGIDTGAVLKLRNQARAFDLCLTLRSLETVPTALALAGGRIAHVGHDGPMAGRTFADVAFHLSFLSRSSRSSSN
jgi:hypothetical protein